MSEEKKWRWADVGAWIKKAFSAILRGKFIDDDGLKFNKYFIHIIYTFALFWASIWLSLEIEKTLTKVEDNQKILNDLEIYYAQKNVQLVGLNRMTTVEKLLQEKGSEVTLPTQQPINIEKTKMKVVNKENDTTKIKKAKERIINKKDSADKKEDIKQAETDNKETKKTESNNKQE